MNTPTFSAGSLQRLGEYSVSPFSVATRGDILRLEEWIKSKLPDPDRSYGDVFPVEHFFAPHLYARQMTIPAGSLIIGKIHRHAHINTVSKGRIKVFSEFGTSIVEAPFTFVSEPGTKRVGIALEDTIWTTYHPTEETDPVKAEEEIVCKTFEEFDAFVAGQKLLEAAP